jgi:hypothetical protein
MIAHHMVGVAVTEVMATLPYGATITIVGTKPTWRQVRQRERAWQAAWDEQVAIVRASLAEMLEVAS